MVDDTEEALAKQKKFAEAEVMRGKIAALEEIEAQRFVGDKSERIAKLTKRVLKVGPSPGFFSTPIVDGGTVGTLMLT